MTWQEALETTIRQTGHEAYRALCSDENLHVRQRDDYRALMVRKATGQPEPQPVPWAPPTAPANQLSSPDPWLPLIRACPDHNPGCCSHPAAFCTRFAKDVSREQCIDCLTADGFGPDLKG